MSDGLIEAQTPHRRNRVGVVTVEWRKKTGSGLNVRGIKSMYKIVITSYSIHYTKLYDIFAGERLNAIMVRLKMPEGEAIEHGMVTRSLESA